MRGSGTNQLTPHHNWLLDGNHVSNLWLRSWGYWLLAIFSLLTRTYVKTGFCRVQPEHYDRSYSTVHINLWFHGSSWKIRVLDYRVLPKIVFFTSTVLTDGSTVYHSSDFNHSHLKEVKEPTRTLPRPFTTTWTGPSHIILNWTKPIYCRINRTVLKLKLEI